MNPTIYELLIREWQRRERAAHLALVRAKASAHVQHDHRFVGVAITGALTANA